MLGNDLNIKVTDLVVVHEWASYWHPELVGKVGTVVKLMPWPMDGCDVLIEGRARRMVFDWIRPVKEGGDVALPAQGG
mgnify:CR=1 FL=1